MSTSETIPPNVYWSQDGGNFYDMHTRKGMGELFFQKWRYRRSEFPTQVQKPVTFKEDLGSEDDTATLLPTDPKELQNDGDPIKAAAMPPQEPPIYMSGVGRDGDHEKSIIIYLSRRPTDNEMRAFGEAARSFFGGATVAV